MSFQIDSGTILKHEYTPEGFLNCYMRIAKTGELKYHTLDGKEVIQVVDRETLFDKDSMRSFKGKPVTKDHPPVKVTKYNSREYMRGLTTPYAVIDGDFLGIVATITDDELIKSIVNGDSVEVSCGYDTELEPIGDNKYRQKYRLGNHVAVVSKGRAGSDVKIQLDSDEETLWIGELEAEEDVNDNLVKDSLDKVKEKLDTLNVESIKNSKTKVMRKFILDGLEFETEDIDLVKHAKSVNLGLESLRSQIEASEKTQNDSVTELENLRSQVKTLTGEKSNLQGQVDGLTSEKDQLKAEVAELKSKPQVDSAEVDINSEVTARLKAWDEVKPYLTSLDSAFQIDTTLDVTAIRKMALTKRFPDRDFSNKDANYVNGCFDSVDWKNDITTTANVDGILADIHQNRKVENKDSQSSYVSEYLNDITNAWKLGK